MDILQEIHYLDDFTVKIPAMKHEGKIVPFEMTLKTATREYNASFMDGVAINLETAPTDASDYIVVKVDKGMLDVGELTYEAIHYVPSDAWRSGYIRKGAGGSTGIKLVSQKPLDYAPELPVEIPFDTTYLLIKWNEADFKTTEVYQYILDTIANVVAIGNTAEQKGNTAAGQGGQAQIDGQYAKNQGDYAKAQAEAAQLLTKSLTAANLIERLNTLSNQVTTITEGNSSTAIDNFNEMVAVFAGLEDDGETIAGIVAGLNAKIATKANKDDVYTKGEVNAKLLEYPKTADVDAALETKVEKNAMHVKCSDWYFNLPKSEIEKLTPGAIVTTTQKPGKPYVTGVYDEGRIVQQQRGLYTGVVGSSKTTTKLTITEDNKDSAFTIVGSALFRPSGATIGNIWIGADGVENINQWVKIVRGQTNYILYKGVKKDISAPISFINGDRRTFAVVVDGVSLKYYEDGIFIDEVVGGAGDIATGDYRIFGCGRFYNKGINECLRIVEGRLSQPLINLLFNGGEPQKAQLDSRFYKTTTPYYLEVQDFTPPIDSGTFRADNTDNVLYELQSDGSLRGTKTGTNGGQFRLSFTTAESNTYSIVWIEYKANAVKSNQNPVVHFPTEISKTDYIWGCFVLKGSTQCYIETDISIGNWMQVKQVIVQEMRCTHEYTSDTVYCNEWRNNADPNTNIQTVDDDGNLLAEATTETPYQVYTQGSGEPETTPVARDQVYDDTLNKKRYVAVQTTTGFKWANTATVTT